MIFYIQATLADLPHVSLCGMNTGGPDTLIPSATLPSRWPSQMGTRVQSIYQYPLSTMVKPWAFKSQSTDSTVPGSFQHFFSRNTGTRQAAHPTAATAFGFWTSTTRTLSPPPPLDPEVSALSSPSTSFLDLPIVPLVHDPASLCQAGSRMTGRSGTTRSVGS